MRDFRWICYPASLALLQSLDHSGVPGTAYPEPLSRSAWPWAIYSALSWLLCRMTKMPVSFLLPFLPSLDIESVVCHELSRFIFCFKPFRFNQYWLQFKFLIYKVVSHSCINHWINQPIKESIPINNIPLNQSIKWPNQGHSFIELVLCFSVINFSTSSQVSFIRTRSDLPVPSSCDVRTYFGTGGIGHSGRELIVAPSLNGGNVLTFFVQTLVKWIESVGGRASESEIWSKIIPVANSVDWKTAQDPAVKPTLYGERYDVNIKASIGNITLGNVDLGGIVRGILKGVIENLDVMLPACYLRESGVTRIVLTGSLFRTFPQLTEHVVRRVPFRIQFSVYIFINIPLQD